MQIYAKKKLHLTDIGFFFFIGSKPHANDGSVPHPQGAPAVP